MAKEYEKINDKDGKITRNNTTSEIVTIERLEIKKQRLEKQVTEMQTEIDEIDSDISELKKKGITGNEIKE